MHFIDGAGEGARSSMTSRDRPIEHADVLAAWRYVDYEMKSSKPAESLHCNGPGIAAVIRW